jgi:hypothetical protein
MDEYPVRPSPIFRNPGKETIMVIEDRLRELRETKQLSQGDIEKRTGLLRCYISRVENGHAVPRALEIPLYQLFYDGDEPPKLPNLLKRKTADDIVWGSSGKVMAQKIANGRGRRASAGA